MKVSNMLATDWLGSLKPESCDRQNNCDTVVIQQQSARRPENIHFLAGATVPQQTYQLALTLSHFHITLPEARKI